MVMIANVSASADTPARAPKTAIATPTMAAMSFLRDSIAICILFMLAFLCFSLGLGLCFVFGFESLLHFVAEFYWWVFTF